jgi:hypothetical protein
MRGLTFMGLTVVFCAGTAPRASACKWDRSPPPSYAESVANGKYLLVMFDNRDVDTELSRRPKEEHAAIRAIYAAYPTSGLYRNDGTHEPVWTLFEYVDRGTAWVSPGGEYMVVQPTSRRNYPKLEIVRFYRDGRHVRDRLLDELVEHPEWIPIEIQKDGTYFMALCGHPSWIISERTQFDDKTLQVNLVTKEGKQFTFDIATGDILAVELVELSNSRSARQRLINCGRAFLILFTSLCAIRVFNPWCRSATATPPTSAGPTPV